MATNPPDLSFWISIGSLVVAAGGFLVNFSFNVVNYRRGSAFRKSAISLDEFKRLRAQLDTALNDFDQKVTELRAFEAASLSGAAWAKSVAVAQEALDSSFSNVRSILTKLDSSEFAAGTDWLSLTERPWDDAANALNGAFHPKSDMSKKKEAVASACGVLSKMSYDLFAKCDGEVQRLRG